MMRAIHLLLVLLVPAVVRADVVLGWNEVALDVVRTTGSAPPVAAWALAITHVAMHDAVNSVEPTHEAFRVYVPEPATTSAVAAAAQAAFRVLLQLYPAGRARLEQSLATSLAQVPDGPSEVAGVQLGNIVAERVLTWRAGDGAHRVVVHPPGTRPGEWRPTPPAFQPALLPQWAFMPPFGIAHPSQFRPSFPPSLASTEYARHFEEVKLLGAANSAARTEEQTRIAYFWADGAGTVTPPGHWNRIAQAVSRESGLSMRDNARLFALLNVALADTAIVCWDMKYACNFWRPITAIHEAEHDGNLRTAADRTWRPLLQTPPFPSCTSGHSTFSGAASRVLMLFFGRDTVQFSDISAGMTRTYRSFSEAAEEAGRSRIYGGIHFEFDNRSGLESGRAAGQYVFDHYLQTLVRPVAGNMIAQRTYRPVTSDGWVSASAPIAVACPAAELRAFQAITADDQPQRGLVPERETLISIGW